MIPHNTDNSQEMLETAKTEAQMIWLRFVRYQEHYCFQIENSLQLFTYSLRGISMAEEPDAGNAQVRFCEQR
jgi:hypothetical protein